MTKLLKFNIYKELLKKKRTCWELSLKNINDDLYMMGGQCHCL